MKRIFTLAITLFLSYLTYAQTPQMICYQAVAANDQGAELTKTNIKVMMKILEGTVSGNAIFTEEHQVTTDEFGLFTLDLGSVNPADFAKIKWGSNKYFLQANLDAGSGYKLIGTNQILSVPYALNAAVAETATDDKDRDSTNELQQLLVDPAAGTLKIVPAGTVGATDQIVLSDKDSDPTNEIQTLKFDDATGNLSVNDKTGAANGTVNIYDRFLGAPGSSVLFPQGTVGRYKFIKATEIYTVPFGYTFYVTANGTYGDKIKIEYKGNNYDIKSYPTCPVLPSTTIISKSTLTGFEVPNDKRVDAVIIDLQNPYQIPPNKTLIIRSGFDVSPSSLIVDGEFTGFYAQNNGSQFVAIPGGQNGISIKQPIGVNSPIFTGYLIDMP